MGALEVPRPPDYSSGKELRVVGEMEKRPVYGSPRNADVMTSTPRRGSKVVPKAVLDFCKEINLKKSWHVLVLLLDGDTCFIEFTAWNSDAFLDHMNRWKKTELPALIRSDVQFFVARLDHTGKLEVAAETFPQFRKKHYD